MTLYGEIVVLNKKSIVFTDSEIRIVQLLADDYRLNEISKMFGVHPQSTHRKLDAIKNKLGIRSTAALVALLYQEKIIK